jgi:hypothetical protein
VFKLLFPIEEIVFRTISRSKVLPRRWGLLKVSFKRIAWLVASLAALPLMLTGK